MTTNHQPTAVTSPSVWTAQRIRDLGAVTDLLTAAAIFGMSRTAAYEAARTGRFPVPMIRAGGRYKVPVAAILTILHIHPDPPSGNDLIPAPNGAWITTTRSEATPTTADAAGPRRRRSPRP